LSKEIIDGFYKILKNIKVPENMLKRGLLGLNEIINSIEDLFSQQKPPEKGWNDSQIKFLLGILASLDTNNDIKTFKIGEREGRISTPLLYDLSGGFTHGIGRSGDIKAPQPKAIGGSILNILTDQMVLFIIKRLGCDNIKGALTIPLSTGMALALTIRAMYNYYFQNSNQKCEFLFLRIDHKSPIKSLSLAGVKWKLIETVVGSEYEKLYPNISISQKRFIQTHGTDAVYVPIEDIEKNINENTVGIISTTTFFPPRAPDNIKEIAKIAKERNLIHIINNAYGIQSPLIVNMIKSAIDAGRVDSIIQSTDKNFLTPVGGSIITSPNSQNLKAITEAYPGRGSATPIIHLFVSLLSMGINKYFEYINIQQKNRKLLEELLTDVARKYNERVLNINNPIACTMSLSNFNVTQLENLKGYLYHMRVTGPRVLIPSLNSFGSSINNYSVPYIVMNAAIGTDEKDIIGAVDKLDKALNDIKSK